MRFTSKANRCGIVLAGGEGHRLRSYVANIRGDDLPKQYVNFIGTRSMLEHTLHRAEKLISSDRLFTVVNLQHLQHPEVGRQLANRPSGTVIVQPENKETAPGIVLPMMHVYKRHPESTVVLFPSDHFVLDEDAFMDRVDFALDLVVRKAEILVLLGIDASEPEAEYGYILPKMTSGVRSRESDYEVMQFIEKPRIHTAKNLIQQGALWNTMVLASKVKTLLDLVDEFHPSLFRLFKRVYENIGTPREDKVTKEVYGQLDPLNFSTGFLETVSRKYPSRLRVIPVRDVFWSDWGSERRILEVLKSSHTLKHGLSDALKPREIESQSQRLPLFAEKTIVCSADTCEGGRPFNLANDLSGGKFGNSESWEN